MSLNMPALPGLPTSQSHTFTTLQNTTLKIITGYSHSTDDIHHEIKVLKIKDLLDLRSTEFIAGAATN